MNYEVIVEGFRLFTGNGGSHLCSLATDGVIFVFHDDELCETLLILVFAGIARRTHPASDIVGLDYLVECYRSRVQNFSFFLHDLNFRFCWSCRAFCKVCLDDVAARAIKLDLVALLQVQV